MEVPNICIEKGGNFSSKRHKTWTVSEPVVTLTEITYNRKQAEVDRDSISKLLVLSFNGPYGG